jgi:LSD1 subclass zinc finger protein
MVGHATDRTRTARCQPAVSHRTARWSCCGAQFSALPGATAIICEGCGRRMDLGSAEIPCASCGAVMTLPAGADRTACPFCQSQVERAGLR